MLITLLLAAVLHLGGPSPDPDPSACIDGWCPVPTTRPWKTDPIHLKGRHGLWVCTVTKKTTMRCVRVSG